MEKEDENMLAEGTASAEALKTECLDILKEEQGGQCGWRRVREGTSGTV